MIAYLIVLVVEFEVEVENGKEDEAEAVIKRELGWLLN